MASRTATRHLASAVLLATAGLGALTSTASAALDATDPSLINLYLLNDQVGSAPFDNNVSGQFKDTGSAPGATPQDHENFTANNPTWASTGAIGTGTGLAFSRQDQQHTRFKPWMHLTQGNYSSGESFTLMVRLNAASLVDNAIYDVIGTGSHGFRLHGSGTPNTAVVEGRLRDPDTFWTLDSNGNGSNNGSSGASFKIDVGQWVNLFLIYQADADPANSVLKVALDDGTTFNVQTATGGAPAGFDPISQGFDNAAVSHWFVGSTGTTTSTFDGMIESIAIWDKALSNSEADAIDLTTINVPEPGAAALAGLGLLATVAHRRRRGN